MSENAVTTTAKKAGQKVKVTFKTITDPARRRVGVAVLVGIIAGIFSGIIKFGWEVPFPPRTPSVTPPTRRRRCWSRFSACPRKPPTQPTPTWATTCPT